MRDSVRILLESHGFVVAEYDSAARFLGKSPECCVLVIDFGLSGVNGLELAEILRSGDYAAPIIFMTDVIPASIEPRVRALAHCKKLNKPVVPSALIALIGNSCSETA